MRLSWRRSSRAENRFETWIAQRHQERVLAGETTAVGPCPDQAFLRDLARRSKRIALSDPRVNHAASCPDCMGRLLALRKEDRSRGRKLTVVAAFASCLLVAAVFVSVTEYRTHRKQPAANVAVASATVDLFDAGTIRGEQPGPLKSVLLPASLVKVTVILPRFSPTGQYAVAVTQDQNGNGIVAQSSAAATSSGDHVSVSVELDLRKAKPGAYFLATIHEQDQASYYYPLRIK